MKNFFKGKIATVIILLATFVLAGVAIFTAIRLYQLRQVAVAPNVPVSIPRAQEVTPTAPPAGSCSLTFTLTVATPTPTASASATPTATPTGTATATPTATPTTTPVPQCNNSCTQNSGCPSNLICSIPSGATTGNCRNTSCTGEASCVCATATPTPRGTLGPTPTPPALPQSGTDWPTMFGIGIGILTIVGSLLLAL